MNRIVQRAVGTIVTLAVIGGLALAIVWRLGQIEEQGEGPRGGASGPVPVEVANIEVGPIADRRVFSGTLAANRRFAVAPKVAGRIERLEVNLGDRVKRGQVVAELDDDEFVQAEAQAQADLLVAEANVIEASSALDIAGREYDRVQTLKNRGVASEAQLDAAEALREARKAEFAVANAQVKRAESAVETARIRRSYTRVTASWPEDDDQRVVAERFVDAGDTVSANAPLVSVVQIDPLIAQVYVAERDYDRLNVGQKAKLSTDAFPGETFDANIVRIAPVFRQASRQAAVELHVSNIDHRLKPGMFARVEIVLGEVKDATIVPESAIVKRDFMGVFIVNEKEKTVTLHEVTLGITDRGRVQITGDQIEGRVVTLGQQLLDTGSAITIPENGETNAMTAAETESSEKTQEPVAESEKTSGAEAPPK